MSLITNPTGTNQPSNTVPFITVIAPQDQILSDASHKETPSNQINAADFATMDMACEDASRAASEMRVIAALVQSVASAISNMDNPIGHANSISSFLKMLSLFNSIVDKIATMCSAVLTRLVHSWAHA